MATTAPGVLTPEREFTPSALQRDECLTSEELSLLVEGTGLRVEAVFEHEAGFHPAAEVFDALQTEAAGGEEALTCLIDGVDATAGGTGVILRDDG